MKELKIMKEKLINKMLIKNNLIFEDVKMILSSYYYKSRASKF